MRGRFPFVEEGGHRLRMHATHRLELAGFLAEQ